MTPVFLRRLLWQVQRLKFPKYRSLWTQLDLEPLDERILPSVTADLGLGILRIIADDNPSHVQVTQPTSDQVLVTESGQSVGTFPADQVQLVVFQYGAAVSTFDNQTPIPAKELRLFNSLRPTPNQLNQTGSLDALLVGDTLTLSGPSGLGFQIIGSWSATDDGGMPDTHTFTASGTMALATAAGTITFVSPDDNPLTITTVGNLTADFGTVTGIQWTTDQVLNSTDPNNPLSTFQNTFGLGIDTGLVQLDVKLGANLGGLGAPLNNALPYIYVTTPTANTAQFGDTVATIGDGNPLTVALDPRDPFLYAQANEFTAGGSLQGYIPYTPALPVQGLNGPLYGHLYGLGTVQPGDVPVTLSGAAVLNLDAAGDGQLLPNLQGNVASQLLTGQLALSDFAQSAPQDLQAGFNGAVMLPYAAAGFALALNGNGSAVYAPGQISVHTTATPDLFNGTPLNIVVPSSPVDLTATYDNQGNVDIIATAAAGTMVGLDASGIQIELNNAGVTVTAHLNAVPALGPVDVQGPVSPNGQFTLTGSVNATLAGFAFSGTLTLSLTGAALAGQVTIPGLGTVAMTGSLTPQGQFQLTGSADITVAGFSLPRTSFTLTNSGMTAAALLTLPGLGSVALSGTIGVNGQVQLTGTANLTIAGFQVTATFTLTNSGLTVSGTVNIPGLGRVTLTGSVDLQGNISLTGTATVNVPGFGQVGLMITLTNSGITVKAALNIPGLGMVMLMGGLDAQGNFSLSGTATVNVPGFGQVTLMLTLTNAGITVKATVNIPGLGMVMLMGTIDAQGNFSLSGTATVNIPGLGQVTLMITVTNAGIKVKATVNIPGLGQVMFMGTIDAQGNFVLTGTATVNIPGFGQVTLMLTLTNNGITVKVTLNIPGLGMVMLTGTIDAQGNFSLTGTATVNIPGFGAVTLMLTLTDTGITVKATLNIPGLGMVMFMGTLDAQGNFVLTGTATVNIPGLGQVTLMLTLTNNGLAVKATINIPGIGMVMLTGTLDIQGNFTLTGTATVNIPGLGQVTLMIAVTNTGITVKATLNIPGLGMVMLTGTIDAQGNFVLKGTVTVTIAGFSASATLTLTNSGLSIQVTLGVLFMGLHPQLAGQINSNGAVRLDGTAQVALDTGRFGPLPLNLGFHMDNQSLRAHAAGNVNWAVHQLTNTFTLQGSFAIDFVVRSDGSFVSAGNFMAVECFNADCSAVPVPFNIDNHVFIIHAPPPFGDVVMQYPMPGTGAPGGGGFPTGKAGTFTFSAGAAAVQLPRVHAFTTADSGQRTVSTSPLTAATAVSGAFDGENPHLTDTGVRGGRPGPLDQTLGTAVGSPESFTMFATAWALARPATPEADAPQTAPGAVAGEADPSAKVVALPPTGSPPVAGSDHVEKDVLPADWESILPVGPLADEMIRALIV
jgi:hypothetical protein